MSNWCENDLIIQGNQVDIDKFLSDFKMTRDDIEVFFDFNLIDPYPLEFAEKDKVFKEWYEAQGKEFISAERPEDGYSTGGKDWLVKNWGTKSNGEDCTLEVSNDSEVILHFITAWSPPTPLVRKLSLKYPNLTFSLNYFEGGMQFSGSHVVAKGTVILDTSCDYFGPRGG